MTKKTFIHLLLCLSISLVSWSVDAHQPVLSSKSANTAKAPYIIEEPEISKAIFSELKGKPHYYRIDSDSKFKFYAGITVPKIDDCPLAEKFSFEVLDTNFRLIERKDGENINWWPWYEMVLNRTRNWGEIQIQQSLQGGDLLPSNFQQI